MTGKDVLRAVGEIDEADIELVKRYGRRRWLKAFAAAAAAMILLGAAFAAGLAAGRGRGEAGQSVSSPSAAPSVEPWETKSEGAFYGVNELKEKWAPPSSEG
ncbi:MAG: hypothetical protein J6P98_06205, partial [Clostridia bacterium]|nr:hypothetical protein [Clostridia bacterium]